MKALVYANEYSWQELSSFNTGVEWLRANDVNSFHQPNDATVYFNLSEDAWQNDYHGIDKPVFINSVCHPLQEIKAGKSVARINGWHGFLQRRTWEVAGQPGEMHFGILSILQKKIVIVPDMPGFISARVIAMVINEAFYAKGENISTEEEIDIAMKLGTNYPYGPFEWAKKIGIKNVYQLLLQLSINDSRYLPSPLLKQETTET